jgi:hypothetical protein
MKRNRVRDQLNAKCAIARSPTSETRYRADTSRPGGLELHLRFEPQPQGAGAGAVCPRRISSRKGTRYSWIPHKTSFGFLDLASWAAWSNPLFRPVLSSCRGGSLQGVPAKRNTWDFMNWPRFASGYRTSTVFNGQNGFFKIAGSKVLDRYCSSYLTKYKLSPIPAVN